MPVLFKVTKGVQHHLLSNIKIERNYHNADELYRMSPCVAQSIGTLTGSPFIVKINFDLT